MALRRACAYYRVSRGRKHRSRLSVARQRAICNALAHELGFYIAEEFIEIELNAGKESLKQRPVLVSCMEYAKSYGYTIIASHLERISRNVNLLTILLHEELDFVFGDLYSDEKAMTLSLYPVRKKQASPRKGTKISTKLKQRRKNGLPIGNIRNLEEAAIRGREVSRQRSDKFAACIYPLIEEIRTEGISSLQAIADELNCRSVRTSRGKFWTPTAVRRILLKVSLKP